MHQDIIHVAFGLNSVTDVRQRRAFHFSVSGGENLQEKNNMQSYVNQQFLH